jgi:hypothetical protein
LTASSCGREAPRKVTSGFAIATRRWSIGFVIAMSTFAAQAAEPQTATLAMQAPKGYFRERCFTLEVGQKLTYQLSTRHSIEFNLHHHLADGTMVYPERLVVKSKLSKQLVAESAGGYCFMATNLEEQPRAFDVVINYEITAP